MSRRTQVLTVEEFPGEDYTSLGAAQGAALSLLSEGLAEVIRALLESGELVERDGRILPKEVER